MMRVGTSGWQYRDWRGRFYPREVPHRLWLEHYAAAFDTVEVNNAFYRLPERTTFEAWRARTPGDFIVTVKASRFLTHVKRLKEPEEPAARLLDRAAGLGDRLGPVLLQLPPTMHADPDALERTLKAFPSTVRVAVEPRHDSWWTETIKDVLTRHDAALCWSDRKGRPQAPLWRTAGWGYLRLHEGRANPWPRYGRAALDTWTGRLAETFGNEDIFVYFNNDPGCAAITDAVAFARLAARRGLTVGRAPDQVPNWS
ncbi:DUF72 domain-containing protein [Dactylosporangium matsuzakiense]|uniref:Histidine kinase n=1 Tax=Dactylosporangium matsuzakiense TaxID=53360 RepID=A0A9W6KVF5_9ACTN|nr:DUF72 domain-containing protein [Dactylosporangium matsuzakiense]UWZ46861.1 DUF72 domain-containing protein [Dactylosporangium matsuzakiense]GLL08822.1 histidine kinase [Dactylosporangium matsuzakiense]